MHFLLKSLVISYQRIPNYIVCPCIGSQKVSCRGLWCPWWIPWLKESWIDLSNLILWTYCYLLAEWFICAEIIKSIFVIFVRSILIRRQWLRVILCFKGDTHLYAIDFLWGRYLFRMNESESCVFHQFKIFYKQTNYWANQFYWFFSLHLCYILVLPF